MKYRPRAWTLSSIYINHLLTKKVYTQMVPYDTMLFFYQYLCALLVPYILHVPPTRIPYLTSKYWHTVFDTKTLGPCKCTRSFALVSLCFVLWKICIVASVASGVVYPHRILLLTFVQFDAFMMNRLIKPDRKDWPQCYALIPKMFLMAFFI